jgi:2-keto-4-pentenoate hydratase/2-oxohepta-3-ene-1,7-dioic acid hydratase in catechol pathway
MRIATYEHAKQLQVGVVSPDSRSVTSFNIPQGMHARGAQYIVESVVRGDNVPTLNSTAIAIDEINLLAPLPVPRRNIWCVGRNYRAHAKELAGSVFKESQKDPESWPIVFSKVPECVIGSQQIVELPSQISSQIDYEAELAVIIGKGGKNIRYSDAARHIFGYTIINDVTARDVQMRHKQWDMGKSFDTFCPMGPWIVTADEMDGAKTRIRCWVNGELRQDDSTENMIFDISTLIETVSRGITLYPGDIIATGTPAGVGMGMSPARYLSSGDVVRIEIDGIGHLENRFV